MLGGIILSGPCIVLGRSACTIRTDIQIYSVVRGTADPAPVWTHTNVLSEARNAHVKLFPRLGWFSASGTSTEH